LYVRTWLKLHFCHLYRRLVVARTLSGEQGGQITCLTPLQANIQQGNKDNLFTASNFREEYNLITAS
jgi:hypothetical protein